MRYNPGVPFFINFYDLDPVAQDKCIFYTQARRRCGWFCRDNARAIELHQRITESETENIFIDDIIEYILSNCCREARAQHRDTIVNVGHLIPLAERWLNEIQTQRRLDETRRQATEPCTPGTAATAWASSPAPSTYANSATSTPNRDTTIETPLTSPSYYRSRSQSSFNTSPVPWKPDASPTPAPRTSFIPANTAQSGIQPARYELRSHEVISPTRPVSRLTAHYAHHSLSEFQPHVQEPSALDSVLWKIREPLDKRDFETGWVYIFHRTSSPGHVKIGWTARSVYARLEDWSKCGYTPIKLFSVGDVPYAQRAETLAHHELIKEWRRERMCKGCGVSHQEWFEVSQEKAIQVLGDWAEFFKKARPYEWNGSLKVLWRDAVKLFDANGEIVTSRKLLDYYEESVKKDTPVIEEPVRVEVALKTEELGKVRGEAKQEEPNSFEEILDNLASIRAELGASREPKMQTGSDTLPPQRSPAAVVQARAEKRPEMDPQINANPSSTFELISKATSKERVVFKAGISSKIEPLSNNGPLSAQDSPAKALPLFKTGLLIGSGPQSTEIQPPKSELANSSRAFSSNPFVFGAKPAFKIEPFSMGGSKFTRELPNPKEPLFGSPPLFKTNELLQSESLFTANQLLGTKPSSDTGKQSTPFFFGPKPPPTIEQSSRFETKPFFKTEPSFKSGPLPRPDALPNTLFDTSAFPKTQFVFEAPSSSKFEQLPKAESSSFESLFKTLSVFEKPTVPGDETLCEELSSSQSAFADEEVQPAQLPLPPSPILEATDGEQNTSAPLGADISEALANLDLDKQAESLNSPTILVVERQTKSNEETKPLSECVKQTVQIYEEQLQTQDDDETTIVEQEAEPGVVTWEEEETLNESLAPLALEMAALDIVDKLTHVACAAVVSGVEKGLDGAKVLEREVSPDVNEVAV